MPNCVTTLRRRSRSDPSRNHSRQAATEKEPEAMPPAPSDCRKSLKSSLAADISGLRAGPCGPVGLRNAPAGAVRRRQRHRQGNFAANCVRGALATSARFAVKFCQRAAEPSAACGGCSEAEQGQRSQSTSTLSRTPCDAGTATRTYTRGNSHVRQLPCAAVASCEACRVSRHAHRPGRLRARLRVVQSRRRFRDPATQPPSQRMSVPVR